jgi:hypothetical protein
LKIRHIHESKIVHVMFIQSFDYERTWWRLLQKRVVSTKLDIYVFITITVSILLLVDYYFPEKSFAWIGQFLHWHGLLDISVIEIYSSLIM